MNNPGCFGAASIYASDSTICQRCHAFDECSAESMKTLEAIKELVNVTDLFKRHEAAKRRMNKPLSEPVQEVISPVEDTIEAPVERKTQVDKIQFAITHEQEEILNSLRVKPQEVARRLCASNMIETIKNDLRKGINALTETKPEFLAVALDSLIKGGFTRKELKQIFIEKLVWGEATASSHVSIVCPIFEAFGIAQNFSGKLVVAPEFNA